MDRGVNDRPLHHAGADFEIIPLSESHISACARIVSGTELWRKYGITYDGAVRIFEDGLRRNEHIFVAVSGDMVLGFVWTMPMAMFGRSGYIKLIGVEPESRGRGIGEKLLHFAEKFLSRWDKDVFLLVSHFNKGAIKFYRRLGYREVGRLPDYAVDGITELLMWKRLTDRPSEIRD